MFIFFSKVLPVFIYPLGAAMGLIGLALFLTRRRRWSAGLLVTALFILWLSSTRGFALSLIRSLEQQHLPPVSWPEAEAIVILGGGVNPQAWPRTLPEVNEAGDRLMLGAWLYREGAAELVIVTGGQMPWSANTVGATVEANSMAQLLTFLGVPAEALRLETASRNTYENALFTRQLLAETGIRRILLVTSASHMPRSVRLFTAQGFQVIPAPADFQVSDAEWQELWAPNPAAQVLNWLPEARYLYMTTTAVKEYIGLIVYRLRGWL